MADTPSVKPDLPIVFLEWLQTGKFLGIQLGSTRDECLKALGQPEDWSTKKRGKRVTHDNAAILKWSQFEFHFGEDDLFLIYSDWQQVLTECFSGLINISVSINFVFDFLEKNRIKFLISESGESMTGASNIKVKRFSLDHGIKLIFYADDSDEVILQYAEQLLS